MSVHQQTRNQLYRLQAVMQTLDLWQAVPPEETAFLSTEPFAVDTMAAHEWLQWIFIPRMHALIESGAALPAQIAISPYVEEALKELEALPRLLSPIIEIERLLQNQ